MVPEIGFNLGYRITPQATVYVGYSLLYASNVARPGDQINRNINPTQTVSYGNDPPVMPVGPRSRRSASIRRTSGRSRSPSALPIGSSANMYPLERRKMRKLSILGIVASATVGAAVLGATAQDIAQRSSDWPAIKGPPVVNEWYSDIPWRQKLGTFSATSST